MSEKQHNLESLVKGGLIGAAIGALLSKDKEEGAMVGALIGAAIQATKHANEEAKKTNQPVLISEGGKLVRIMPSGERKTVRDLSRGTVIRIPRKKLK